MGVEENQDCPCTWDCPRHGKCSECHEYHHNRGEKTSCGKWFDLKMPLIDLTTKDSELDSIILEEYPGIIYAGQHNQFGTRDDRIYWF